MHFQAFTSLYCLMSKYDEILRLLVVENGIVCSFAGGEFLTRLWLIIIRSTGIY
jgi:hypothetical protein